MKTIAIITGDIINSRGHNTAVWMDSLKSFLLQFGDTPSTWEIYRGDEIQIRMPMKQALYAALQLKAL
ncbi:MAG: hypothetical protein HKN53_11850, partial [Maribacter sp.]|nr:hypothetical protein [Maribacter sp.]